METFMKICSSILSLATSAIFLSAIGTIPLSAQEKGTCSLSQLHAPFTLPNLPYETSSLDPSIDTQTMEIHWGKHHKTYVDNLNLAYQQNPKYASMDLETLFTVSLNELPLALRNNGGGHWNHSFFWLCLTPDAKKKIMPVELQAAIQASFGSLDNMKNEIEKAGLSRFGSGWIWLIQRPDGSLAVTTTANQDNPLMNFTKYSGDKQDIPLAGTPILAIDVWEHAYYLKYRNQRKSYLDEIWNVINWSFVGSQLQKNASSS